MLGESLFIDTPAVMEDGYAQILMKTSFYLSKHYMEVEVCSLD